MVALAGLLLAQSSKPLADIPFELIDNTIHLEGSLNGRHSDAVLDSGSFESVADTAFATSVGGKKLREIDGGAKSPTGQKAYDASNLTFALLGTTIRQSIRGMMPLSSFSEVARRPIRIIIGTDFLKRFRVEIDYAAGRVRLYDPRKAVVTANATVVPVKLIDNLPFVLGNIEIVSGKPQPTWMLVDTGDGRALTVTSYGVRRFGLAKRFVGVPVQSSSVGIDGNLREKEVRFGAMRIGNDRLVRPIAELQMDSGDEDYDAALGGEVLRRFTVTFDYAHQRMLLRRNKAYEEPFEGDEFGLVLRYKPGGGIEIKEVVPGSPAAMAGLVGGEEILEIDGHSLRNATSREFEGLSANRLRLKVRISGAVREVVLKPRDFVP